MQYAKQPAARQRLLPDEGIVDGEVSFDHPVGTAEQVGWDGETA
jgi:hypothetical protein